MVKYNEEVYRILKDLCQIPAPSHFEEERAKYCKEYFVNAGFDKVYIDEAKNAICEMDCDGSSEITIFAAHTDTVFPDLEPMPYYEKDGKAFCPGVCDDTGSVAVLMAAAKYMKDNDVHFPKGIIFACNSCEEGLGNLKGIRAIMEKYKGRVARFITLDSNLDVMAIKCVGSHRYKVTAKTQGGHSFGNFGNKNAIASLAEMVGKIYEIEVPVIDDSKTTYNVGIIEGGTSVNTIAQNASMMCEYRSDDVKCLEIMKEKFEKIFADANTDETVIEVEKIGDRPCANDVNEADFNKLVETSRDIIENIIDKKVTFTSSSTDCNIPMSLGVPSVCVGVWYGDKMHTREEWIDLESLKEGFKVAIELMKVWSK